MINLSENQPVLMPHGQHKGKPLNRLPLFYLKWLARHWSDPKIRGIAQEVIEHRQRLGLPEKVKRAKKPDNQKEMPLQDDKIAKAKPKIVDFIVQDASKPENDLF